MNSPHADPLPVEFVSATQFSQLTAGVKNAPEPIDNATGFGSSVGAESILISGLSTTLGASSFTGFGSPTLSTRQQTLLGVASAGSPRKMNLL